MSFHGGSSNIATGVAILVCSAAKAEQAGLDPRRWIYPVAAIESKHVVVLAQQRQLHSHLGTIMCGERALELARATVTDLAAAELYSCFPAAIQSFAFDLRLPAGCPLTVTGSMAFAGGPFNHASLEGVARMVEVLREKTAGETTNRQLGVVANLSGIFGKQACALFSNLPNDGGYRYENITAAVAARELPVPLDEAYVGPATIVGYTVVFNREEPTHAIAICDTPSAARTVARTEDETLVK